MYTVVGWYDLFTAQDLKNFMEMTKPAIAANVRSKQKIIIGPWGHGTWGDSRLGDLDFGKESTLNDQELMLRFVDMFASRKVMFTAPGVPPDRVQFLRETFEKMVANDGFVTQARLRWPVWAKPVAGKDMRNTAAVITGL